MNKLPFAYPIRISQEQGGLVHLTCADLPEMRLSLPASMPTVRMLDAAEIVLDSVVEYYIAKGKDLPRPSVRDARDFVLAPTPAVIIKAGRHLGR